MFAIIKRIRKSNVCQAFNHRTLHVLYHFLFPPYSRAAFRKKYALISPISLPKQHGKLLGADGDRSDQNHRHGVRHHHVPGIPGAAAALEAKSPRQTTEGNAIHPPPRRGKAHVRIVARPSVRRVNAKPSLNLAVVIN